MSRIFLLLAGVGFGSLVVIPLLTPGAGTLPVWLSLLLIAVGGLGVYGFGRLERGRRRDGDRVIREDLAEETR